MRAKECVGELMGSWVFDGVCSKGRRKVKNREWGVRIRMIYGMAMLLRWETIN